MEAGADVSTFDFVSRDLDKMVAGANVLDPRSEIDPAPVVAPRAALELRDGRTSAPMFLVHIPPEPEPNRPRSEPCDPSDFDIEYFYL